MSDKKKDIDIEILSNIDDEIVERNTRKRFTLFRNMIARKRKRKILTVTLSSAASFLLICGILLSVLIPMLAGNVPVYRGMTVSTESPLIQSKKASILPGFGWVNLSTPDYLYVNPSQISEKSDPLSKDDPAKPKTDEEKIKEVEDSLSVVGSEETLYYAKPNGTIYITVHIDNPDNYEILSFTLNGAKYSAYMFEEGSDMENLVLKVDVKDAEGFVEYTIDAIKYVKGEKIKDVRMEGDKTVKVGVGTEKQPTVKVTNTKTSFKDISFDVTVYDALRLVELSGGRIDAVLYEGDELVATQSIAPGGTTTVEFKDLRPGIDYNCWIMAFYDDLSGDGFGTHILSERLLFTETVLGIEWLSATKDSVSYTLEWNEGQNEREINSIALYLGDNKVREVATDVTTIDGILSDTEYKIVVEYKYNGNTEIIYKTFKTYKKATPEVSVTDINTKLHAIEFKVNEKDTDNVANVTKVELFCGDMLVKSSNELSAVTFDGLDSDTYYTAVVTYEYDMNNGDGVQIGEVKVDIKTKYDFGVGEWAVSRGLQYSTDGEYIYGIGQCRDTVIFIDKPMYSFDMKDVAVTTIYIDAEGEIPALAFGTSEIYDGSVGVFTLETVLMSDSVTGIGESAFENCESLKNLRLSANLETIGKRAFAGCTQLTSVDIPSGVKVLEQEAFAGCTALASITLHEGLQRIRPQAFAETAIQSIVVPDSVTTMGGHVFRNCYNLSSVKLPAGIKQITTRMFDGCTSLTSIEIPSGVQKIGKSAFEGSSVKNITLPNGIVEIGEKAFAGCPLESIILPDTLKTIGVSAFDGCAELREIIIPAGVTTVGMYAFDNCPNIRIYCEADSKPEGWDVEWYNGSTDNVVWGYKKQ